MTTMTDRDALLADFAALADAIATALNRLDPRGWTRTTPDTDETWGTRHYHCLDGGDDRELGLTLTRGRLVVRGHFPYAHGTSYHPRGESHEITVAANKPAVKIAADIARRLLPRYLPAVAAAIGGVRQDANARTEAWRVAVAMATRLGLKPPDECEGPTYTFYPSAEAVYKVTVDAGGRVKVETTSGLTLAQAEVLLGALGA